MCGIWALISLKNSKIDDIAKYFKDFWNIQNRGPDNSSLETFPQICVGFHRLAIMDRTFKSNQPFVFQEKTKTIVFVCNGEIYNFKELIEEFNLPIYEDSDCKTIPELYKKLDYDTFSHLFLDKIKGEFAFCLFEYDVQQNLTKIITGRDQIGIRPLYYHPPTHDSKYLMFSSEIKGMCSFDNHVCEYQPGLLTTYNISKFSNVTIDKFDFKNYIPKALVIHSNNHYIEQVRNSTIESIKRRLNSDRPMAFLLSGGIDSSIVCAVAAKIIKTPINTFCCGMNEGTDIKYAREVSKFIGSSHTEVFFTEQDGLNAIRDVIYATETWDTTTIRASVGQYLVSKYISTKTDARVVLVGEGPDEVCSSYMFNWYAPDSEQLDKCSKEYVQNIYKYDVKRADRCISHWGLEGRVPLLDPEFIRTYWNIPSNYRHPKYMNIEKYWLRKAFEDILPESVVWRTKEAFSDGVSSKKRSWFEIIQTHIDTIITDEEYNTYKDKFPSKEAYYYMKVFEEFYPNRSHIIDNYWLPKWNKDGKEITKYIDPSARVLDVYK